MELLFTQFLDKPLWLWLAFFGIVVFLLVLDLGLFNRDDHEIGVAESLKLSAFYIALGLSFAGFIWWQIGADEAKIYLTAYVIEKSLSMDNIFVIALIFGYFAIPRMYQHRALFWGIIGVIVLRGIMIVLGATLVNKYHWILYVFAAFLIVTGIRMLFSKDDDEGVDMANNPVLKFIRRHVRVTDKLHGHDFVTRLPDPKTGKLKLFATPLLLALVMVELADVLFAVDSVPAVFSLTTDPYLVFTSNIFAILGLRALYFALAAILHRFHYLKYALAVLLVFIGSKVFVADLMDWEKFPASVSLGVTFTILAIGVGVSLWMTRGEKPATALPGEPGGDVRH